MNIYSKRPQWIAEPIWRALRTFVQSLIPAMGFFIADYSISRSWSWEELWFVVVIPTVAATLSWLSNQMGDSDETNV